MPLASTPDLFCPADAAAPSTSHRAEARPDPRAERWQGLDFLRFIAVVLMVQGHAFRVILVERERALRWFDWHDFVHGFTAPAFLLGAGLAWGAATFPDLDRQGRWSAASRRRFARYGLLFAIGCALNLPDMSFGRALTDPSRLLHAIHLGPLHLLGIMLALVETTAVLTRSRRAVAALAGCAAVAILLSAPLVSRIDERSPVPEALRALLNGTTGSAFPIFPWGGLALLGVSAAHLALDERGRLRRRASLVFGLVGAALIAGCYALYRARFAPYGPHDFWRYSPIFMGFLTGGVWVALALTTALAPSLPPPIERVVGSVARHSLVVYVAHLVALYGSPLFRGLRHYPGPTLSLGSACALTGVLLAAMGLVATLWPELRRRNVWSSQLVRLPLAGLLVYVLLLR
jgi:uncharacterized membrane protein